MRRPLARLGQVIRRRWLLLALLALLCGGGAFWAGPQLWAWYHLRAAETALQRYHSAEASDHLRVCLQVWPSRPRVHLLAGRAARQSGDYDEAEQHLRACQRLEQTPSDDTSLEWALLHAAMGDMDRTEEDYLQSRLQKDPAQAPLISEALAEGYLRTYRIFDALACLNRWLEHEPDNPQALFQRGNVFLQVKSPQQAVPDYLRVVDLDPERTEARRRLALCLLDQGKYGEALPYLEEVRKRQPGDADVRVSIARCQNMVGEEQQARETLDAVLAEHPKHGLALRTRGQLALRSGQAGEAEKWLREAVRLLPDDYQASWSLYQALQAQHRDADAKAQLARAEQLKERLERLAEISTRQMSARPHDPALHCELGTLLLGLGHRELGERWLLSALKQDGRYRPAHAALAEYYKTQGDTEKTEYHRQQAQAAPANARAR